MAARLLLPPPLPVASSSSLTRTPFFSPPPLASTLLSSLTRTPPPPSHRTTSIPQHPRLHPHCLALPTAVQLPSSDPNVDDESITISRNHFPSDFTFGTSTSAFQVEGGAAERGISIWDTFAHVPGNIVDGSVGAVTCDQFHKFREDMRLMKNMGADAYRLSISWPRLIPDGSHNVSPEGVSFYNTLINSAIKEGLVPYVTIYHWDLPQQLENDPDVKGWRTKNILKHYQHFAETCFRAFGDRVKHWITFNEMHIIAYYGWGTGQMAPGRCSEISGFSCSCGDSSTEPYTVLHHMLLSHAAAVKIYREKYQKEQKGAIGYAADSQWYEPYNTSNKEDITAAKRYLEFATGWQLDPLILGDYPKSMRDRVGDRLPKFTPEESHDLKGSVDFIGINYYLSSYVKNLPEEQDATKRWWATDVAAETSAVNSKGDLVGPQMGPPNSWIYYSPWGLNKLLAWFEDRYGKDIPIYITENGVMDPNADASIEMILNDQERITYMKGHLKHLAKAVRDEKRNVKGYFAWSFMDNFEWYNGFTFRFGLVYVDFHDDQRRYLKASAKWYSKFLEKPKHSPKERDFAASKNSNG